MEIFSLVLGSVIGYFFAKQKFRFESAHKKRIEVIEEVYKRLSILQRAFKSLMNPLQFGPIDKKSKKDFLAQTGNDFSDYFYEKKIFIDKEIGDDIEKIIKEFQTIWAEWESFVDFPNADVKEKHQHWKRIWEVLDKDMNITLSKLESKFRIVLGIK